jgi:NAD(P)-dependent dehydrogenase (short-subunit alcohol dehydrogenase family)
VTEKRVVVVTGGGGGIGAAIAEELGRNGDLVVTVDPLVSVDGSEQLPRPEVTTAGRIVEAGGWARASSVSVTDADAVRALFQDLVEEFGRLDAVVNVAGISRPTSFTRGADQDWRSVLTVHLDGYLNILAAALPIMAVAGHGRVLGVTSGSGWRAADTGAYGCAKRAVASLTWQLGALAPPGVTVNAMSPIAMTRMVTAALGRAPRQAASGSGSSTGGLSLGSMPTPDQLGPTGAHLASDDVSWCQGQVIFVGGSELAVIDPPRLLEVVRTADTASSALALALESASLAALAPAEASQASSGGSNPRVGPVFDGPPTGELPPPAVTSCVVVTDRPEVAAAVTVALGDRGVVTRTIEPGDHTAGFDGVAAALASSIEREGPIDAVVVALAGPPAAGGTTSGWEQLLAEHAGIVEQIHADAGWSRAVADHASRTDRPVRLVTLSDATTGGGRSRAQAAAQLARSARSATADRVLAFAVSVETSAEGTGKTIGEIVAHLLCSPETPALAGAELVADAGWFGLRSHPRAGASVIFGGPAVPDWVDGTLRSIVR